MSSNWLTNRWRPVSSFRYYALLVVVSVHMLACEQAETQPEAEIYAHRGFRGLYPENTIQAMQQALEHGAILELDLAITADRKAVLSHDPVLDPKITTAPNGGPLGKGDKYVIFQMGYDSIRAFDVGNKPHPDFPDQERFHAYMPLFGEMIDSVEHYAATRRLEKPRYFVETKLRETTDGTNHPGPQEFVDVMMEVVDTKQIRDRLIVQSFDPRTLQILREQHPDVKIAFLARSNTSLDDNLQWLGYVPDYYSINSPFIDTALVEQCDELGITLIVGNCNDYGEIVRTAQLGVHRVITDFPLEWLAARHDKEEN